MKSHKIMSAFQGHGMQEFMVCRGITGCECLQTSKHRHGCSGVVFGVLFSSTMNESPHALTGWFDLGLIAQQSRMAVRKLGFQSLHFFQSHSVTSEMTCCIIVFGFRLGSQHRNNSIMIFILALKQLPPGTPTSRTECREPLISAPCLCGTCARKNRIERHGMLKFKRDWQRGNP